jgi:alpha-1,3-rhamnosyl/mannosyltransferase
MRVVIDATPLLVRSAGVKNYLYYWIQHLQRAAGPGVVGTFPHLEPLGALNHERSVAGFWRTWSGLGPLALANHTRLPVADWVGRDADIFHASHLFEHPPRRARLTATIYDVTTRLMPELHSAGNLRADRGFANLCRYARKLIAISHSTKADAVRVLGLPPEKIVVIHPGVPDAFFAVPPGAVESVRERYALQRPFVLFVGTIEPRKNVDALLDAYRALAPSLREEFELVLAGPIGWAGPETIARLGEARYLGYIPEPDLAPLTAAAAVFVYPSLYEGFGFPVAQALAAGVPVVTSNVSSLPEVAGDAALLVDPRSASELGDAIARLLLAPDLRAELGARGRCRAQEFRWETCAARSLRFFQELVDGS